MNRRLIPKRSMTTHSFSLDCCPLSHYIRQNRTTQFFNSHIPFLNLLITKILAGLPDFKSIVLNLASFFLFILPFGAYFDTERLPIYGGAVVGMFAIALLAPPIGWWRPHPYSDFPHNRGTAPAPGQQLKPKKAD